jgi:hypothetical protein
MSKVDPAKLTKLDRRSTILLQAARNTTEAVDEKSVMGMEDPGMDAIRGSFGPVGSIIRARSARRFSQSKGSTVRSRETGFAAGTLDARSWISEGLATPGAPPQQPMDLLSGMKRHQLFDPPVPTVPLSPSAKSTSLPPPRLPVGPGSPRRPTIKFDSEAMVHSYRRPGSGDDFALHERRKVDGTDTGMPYPPTLYNTDAMMADASPVEERGRASDLALYDDKIARGASPTVSPRFAQNYGVRPDARDIFSAPQSSSSSGNLLATSSSSEEDVNTGSQRGRRSRRYPKGAGDDDREESVSLFREQLESSVEDDRSDETLTEGGIRLVQPSSRTQL